MLLRSSVLVPILSILVVPSCATRGSPVSSEVKESSSLNQCSPLQDTFTCEAGGGVLKVAREGQGRYTATLSGKAADYFFDQEGQTVVAFLNDGSAEEIKKERPTTVEFSSSNGDNRVTAKGLIRNEEQDTDGTVTRISYSTGQNGATIRVGDGGLKFELMVLEMPSSKSTRLYEFAHWWFPIPETDLALSSDRQDDAVATEEGELECQAGEGVLTIVPEGTGKYTASLSGKAADYFFGQEGQPVTAFLNDGSTREVTKERPQTVQFRSKNGKNTIIAKGLFRREVRGAGGQIMGYSYTSGQNGVTIRVEEGGLKFELPFFDQPDSKTLIRYEYAHWWFPGCSELKPL